MAGMDDQELNTLLERVSQKDRRAFETLYDRTSPLLFAVCLRVLRDRGEAEEALQEVYLKIWRKADRFARTSAPVTAWLATIARHAAIDRRRRLGLFNMDDTEVERVEDRGPTPEETAMRSSEARRLQECLEELDPAHAELVRTAFFTGRTYGELAASVNKPLGTVKSWIRRSLIKLRQCLDGIGVTPGAETSGATDESHE